MRDVTFIGAELKAARRHWEACDHDAMTANQRLADADKKVAALTAELKEAMKERISQVYANIGVDPSCKRCAGTRRIQPHGDVCPDCFGASR